MINLENNFFLDSDLNEITLKEFSRYDKENKKVFKIHGHYSNLGNALNGYLNLLTKKMIQNSMDINIMQFIQAYDDLVIAMNEKFNLIKQNKE